MHAVHGNGACIHVACMVAAAAAAAADDDDDDDDENYQLRVFDVNVII